LPAGELVPELIRHPEKITAWRHDYNEQQPHSSLNYMTPSEFAAKQAVEKTQASPA
jgi:putative transposase